MKLSQASLCRKAGATCLHAASAAWSSFITLQPPPKLEDCITAGQMWESARMKILQQAWVPRPEALDLSCSACCGTLFKFRGFDRLNSSSDRQLPITVTCRSH